MELNNIHGIGDATIKSLNKLNIYTITDLINYYPYRYNIYNPTNINEVKEDETITINGIVESIPKIVYVRRNLNILSFRFLTNNKLINVTIYNRAFLKRNITVGKSICIIGKYNLTKHTLVANNILFKPLLNTVIEPVYHVSGTIKNKTLSNIINKVLNELSIEETLPNYLKEEYNFINEIDAIKEIHNPLNQTKLKQSKLLLIYKEFFEFMFKINYLKIKRSKEETNYKKEFDFILQEIFQIENKNLILI